MTPVKRLSMAAGCGLLALVLVGSCLAVEIEDQLSIYTGDNGVGYLQPLADAVGTDLNSGLFQSAHIPKQSMYLSVEFRVMSVQFGDDDKTFEATTESGFSDPPMRATAPTVVGSGEAVYVENEAGARFYFPGGFDLGAFTLAVPQIRFGSYYGTEAIVRYIAIEVGDNEFGDGSLFGFGLRHSISQYLDPDFPVDLAGGFFWQKFHLGENNAGGDLISSDALTFGVQASKRYGEGAAYFEPYAGLALDRSSMDVSYEGEDETLVDLDFGTDTTVRFTLGLAARLAFINAHAEYSLASQNSLSFGLAFGNW
jgi:hypothetical protein